LKTKTDLCEKLIGHKRQGIVVAHRYASGGITTARDLIFAIQESVKAALVRQNVPVNSQHFFDKNRSNISRLEM